VNCSRPFRDGWRAAKRAGWSTGSWNSATTNKINGQVTECVNPAVVTDTGLPSPLDHDDSSVLPRDGDGDAGQRVARRV
jgi:hypothetical protein